MRFALSNLKERIEPTPGAVGFCGGCNAPMVARCGTKKVWHWAHKAQLHCDPWWENETEWHRCWKNYFPTDWQEVPARDASGELHIADVKTPHGIVIEFQHSGIRPEEVQCRTTFYGNVIWIIDGMRRATDILQHAEMLEHCRRERFDGVDIYTVYESQTRLLKEWGSLGCIVGFDFGGDNICLLTAAQGRQRYLFDFSKNEFARILIEGQYLPRVQFGQPQIRRTYSRRR